MPFYPVDQPVPPGLHNNQFLLEPLTPKHGALDYAAVMESKTQLRIWGGHGWPADDFSLADNMEDMHFHYREHKARIAFTYTVLAPAEDRCLGCVYIRNLGELAAHGAMETAVPPVAGHQAMLRFWVRTSRLPHGDDRALLQMLRNWLREDWPFQRVLVHTPAAETRQLALFRNAALAPVFSLEIPERGGLHHFFDVLG